MRTRVFLKIYFPVISKLNTSKNKIGKIFIAGMEMYEKRTTKYLVTPKSDYLSYCQSLN